VIGIVTSVLAIARRRKSAATTVAPSLMPSAEPSISTGYSELDVMLAGGLPGGLRRLGVQAQSKSSTSDLTIYIYITLYAQSDYDFLWTIMKLREYFFTEKSRFEKLKGHFFTRKSRFVKLKERIRDI
jgi:hypothetical protein